MSRHFDDSREQSNNEIAENILLERQIERLEKRLLLAEQQRLAALKNAFSTIREFATPSLSPDKFDSFEDFEKALLNEYRIIE